MVAETVSGGAVAGPTEYSGGTGLWPSWARAVGAAGGTEVKDSPSRRTLQESHERL